MEPHRGTTSLVLGILGIVICPICGIIAWIMANTDLPKMEAGTMDPEGLGMTKAGKICGIISVILWVIGLIVTAILVFVIVGAAASQAGGMSG